VDHVILGNRGKYCSFYKLQEKTEYRLIKTTVISSDSHFNLVVETLFGGTSPQKTPWRRDWILSPLCR